MVKKQSEADQRRRKAEFWLACIVALSTATLAITSVAMLVVCNC